MRRIRAIITNTTIDRAWGEEYDIADNENATSYMTNIINNFNNTLRPGEKPRTLIATEEVSENGIQQHQYEKTNLVTIQGRNGMYDTCKCRICGVTGKRYGLGGTVIRDSKYKAKCYENCTTTLKHLHR